jgi:hypothetical protein
LALLSLGIGIAPPRYLHPWSFSITPLGIGIPSLLVSASPLPRYWHPALSTPPSSVSVSLALRHRRYQASVSFSCLRTPLPSSASASLSAGFVSLLPLYKPVSPLFLHTNQPPYRNTQTFPAEQSSLQLYNIGNERYIKELLTNKGNTKLWMRYKVIPGLASPLLSCRAGNHMMTGHASGVCLPLLFLPSCSHSPFVIDHGRLSHQGDTTLGRVPD